MKRILLLVVTISLVGFVRAQETTWEVYLRGRAVKSIDFENEIVWVATDNSLVRLNTVDKSTTFYWYPYIDENGSSYKLKIDKIGVKWIARSEYVPSDSSIYERYRSSIYSFDGNQWKKIESLGYGQISSLAVDKNNNKWIAKVGKNGLYRIDQDTCMQHTPENSGLVYNHVAQVASDKDGNIWVSNYGNLGSLASADYALAKNDGEKWTSYFLGRDLFVNSLTIDSQGNPWVQNPWLTKKLDTISKSWLEPISLDIDNHILLLHAIEGESKFWYTRRIILTDKGIAVNNGSNWNFFNRSNSALPSDMVYQIAIDSDHTKWIGTDKGLVAFNDNSLKGMVGIKTQIMNKIELFPNPASDYLTLKIPNEIQNSTVDILTIQGKVMKSFSLSNDQNRLDLCHFPAGVYLVRIKSDENHIVKKFVKEK